MLKELEKRLNDYWKVFEECGQEFYTFKVKECKDGDLMVKCFNDDGSLEWIIEAEYNSDMAALIKNIIYEFYETMMNPHSRVVKNFKGYSARKIKSLRNWMLKENEEKVKQVNLDMIEQYKKYSDAKFIVSENKKFVNMFYFIKEEFEPAKEIV